MHKKGGGSGVNRKQTMSAINDAIANGHLKVNGYSSSGYAPGSRYVTVNVPANSSGNNRAFTVQMEIGGDSKSKEAFKDSHAIVSHMRNNRFNKTVETSHGLTTLPNETGQFEQKATYSFEFNPETRVIEPVMNISYYKVTDSGVSSDVYKSVGPNYANTVSPQNMSKFRGMSVLDDLMNVEMKDYKDSGDPFSFLTAEKNVSHGQQ
jgi:hypothetical protein